MGSVGLSILLPWLIFRLTDFMLIRVWCLVLAVVIVTMLESEPMPYSHQILHVGYSRWHLSVHQSPLLGTPSSHVSGYSTLKLPHSCLQSVSLTQALSAQSLFPSPSLSILSWQYFSVVAQYNCVRQSWSAQSILPSSSSSIVFKQLTSVWFANVLSQRKNVFAFGWFCAKYPIARPIMKNFIIRSTTCRVFMEN